MKEWFSRVGDGHKRLVARLHAASSFARGAIVGVGSALVCYLSTFAWPPHLPILRALGIAVFVTLVLMLLDAGPGRESTFARAVFSGVSYGAGTFAWHARNPTESLLGSIVVSLLCGVAAALGWRFYGYDPREKRSTLSSPPLH